MIRGAVRPNVIRRGRVLVATVLAVVLVGALGTSVAAAADPPVPAGIVLDVHGGVDDRTPLYNLTLDFTLAGVQCPAVLDYAMGNMYFTDLPICTGTGPGPTTFTHQRPVFGNAISPLAPEGNYPVQAYVRQVGSGFDYGEEFLTTLPTVVHAPPAPIWVGVGDGYTSARDQDSTSCAQQTQIGTPACDDNGYGLNRNDPDSSWINEAVGKFNFGENRFTLLGQTIPDAWLVESFDATLGTSIVANDAATAASFAPGGPREADQIPKMVALLNDRKGSWNWVGVSGGLLDSGIQQAFWTLYGGAGPAANGTASGINTGTFDPWAIPLSGAGSTNPCPNLSSVVANVNAAQTGIVNGLKNVVNKAQVASPGTRVVMVQYPWLTENTNDTAILPNRNKCAADNNGNGTADNREGINRLDEVIQTAVDSFAPAPGRLPLVYNMDLRSAFGERPTGSNASRADAALQVTRPWGYPYPNDGGRGRMGDAAVAAAKGSGEQVPEAAGRIVVNSSGATATPYSGPAGNWYNSSGLSVEFSVSKNGSGSTWVDSICWPSRPGIPADCITNSDTSLKTLRAPLLEARDLSYTATVKDSAGHVITVSQSGSLDLTAPIVGAAVLPSSGGGGWFNASQNPVDVTFGLSDRPSPATGAADDAAGANNNSFTFAVTPSAGGTASGWSRQTVGGVSNVVRISANGTYSIVATGCDNANHCSTSTATVIKADFSAPTVTMTQTTTAWTNAASVGATWTWADPANGSGLAGTGTTETKTVTVEGQTILAGTPRSDVAGNTTTPPSATIRIDRTAPTVSLVGTNGLPLVGTVFATLPVVQCLVTEVTPAGVNAVSGAATGCAPTFTTTTVTGGTQYTFNATGRDNAGNTANAAPLVITVTAPVTPPATHVKDGRMNGGGTFGTGGVKVAFTLRCNGRPDMLDVFFDKPAPAPVPAAPAGTSASAWKAFLEWLADQYGSSSYSAQTNNGNGNGHDGNDDDDDYLRFTMTQVTSELCTDTSANPGQPKAPFDTYSGTGIGKLSDGRTATIEWTFTDAGEPGKNDTAKIVIKVGSTVILSAGPAKLTDGNFQAMYAQGNGANNWDDRDDSYSGAGWKWKDDHGWHDVDYDRNGCHYKRETSKRYHYEDDDRYGNRKSRDDYKRR